MSCHVIVVASSSRGFLLPSLLVGSSGLLPVALLYGFRLAEWIPICASSNLPYIYYKTWCFCRSDNCVPTEDDIGSTHTDLTGYERLLHAGHDCNLLYQIFIHGIVTTGATCKLVLYLPNQKLTMPWCDYLHTICRIYGACEQFIPHFRTSKVAGLSLLSYRWPLPPFCKISINW